MSNNAKNTLKHQENTNKTCFEAFWEILENPVLGSKMWFSAQISNYAEIPWNSQKTQTKHVLRLFKKFVKIRFSAKKSDSRPRCRTMLKILETLRKHQLNTLWGILRIFSKSDSWLKIRFSAQMSNNAKIPWNTQKTPPKHVLIPNNLLAMVRCLGQPTLFIVLQMICTDQNWGSC